MAAHTAKKLPHWKQLNQLTDLELARLILRQLWQWQSASGVSHGRSPRNVLLEGFINLVEIPKRVNADAWNENDLLAEAQRRVPNRNTIPKPYTKVPAPSRISDFRFAMYMLELLNDFYEEDERAYPLESLRHERELLRAALRLLPIPKPFPKKPHWGMDQLYSDSRERYRKLLAKKYNR